MKKLFIYSLPRAGSTLLQKYLYRNNEMSTISEPWILLPIYYMFKHGKVFSEYEHHLFMRSFIDLEKQGIDKGKLSSEMIKAFAEVYYNSVADPAAKVFIDKTPRYSVICHEIINDFSDDYHIVLFRHPLSCVSSMIKTFGGGNWCLYRFEIDLFLGLPNMIQAAKNENGCENLLIIRYEDFVSDPEDYYQSICSMLDLDAENKVELHENPLQGTLGDPVGEKKFGAKVGNQNSEYSWNASFNTLYRRWWAKMFLQEIGEESFTLMGYDITKTRDSINTSKYSFIQELKDIPFILLAFIHRHTGVYVTYVKLKRAFKGIRNFGER